MQHDSDEPNFHYHDNRGYGGRCQQCVDDARERIALSLVFAIREALDNLPLGKLSPGHGGLSKLVGCLDDIVQEWPI